MTRNLFKVGAGLAIAGAIAACGSDSTAPNSALVGNYTAFQFVTTGGSGQTNQLTAGSTVQLTLNADGSTSGHMHLAATSANPAGDFDLAGTWQEHGNVVDLTQTADTFLRDVTFTLQPFAAGAWDLVADQTFAGTRVQLTLRRVEGI
jgi:hypothetical protein